MYRPWVENWDKGQCVIVRSLNGNELKDELVKQLAGSGPMFYVDFTYREVKNVEIVDNNNAILTYEISDMYKEEMGNDEKFEIKVLVNEDTIIYRSDELGGEHYTIDDLDNIKYVPERVKIYLDSSTTEDEIATASKVDVGWLDEDF